MKDTDYVDDQVLLINTPAQAESLLYSPEQAAECIGCDVNANKTELMCFKQWLASELSRPIHKSK